MNLTPLQDRVLVRRVEEDTKTAGGIIIPDNHAQKPHQGIVIAVGSGTVLDNGTLIPLEVKEGDTVLFGKYSGTEVKVNGELVLVMKEEEILGIFNKDDN